jgi:hypothetical protein
MARTKGKICFMSALRQPVTGFEVLNAGGAQRLRRAERIIAHGQIRQRHRLRGRRANERAMNTL